MKVSLALARRPALSRQTAWGCLTTNLAMPGLGTLAAGRFAGYSQLALAVLGLGLTSGFGTRFVLWYFANRSRMSDPQSDPFVILQDLWLASRWALFGIAVFLSGWLWALISSLAILRRAKAAEAAAPPPGPANRE